MIVEEAHRTSSEIDDDMRPINSKICYRAACEKGLGVFALCDIRANTVVTFDVFRTIRRRDRRLARSTDLYHLLFVDRRTYDQAPNDCELHVAFGPISMVNHAESPNCNLHWEYNGLHSYVYLIALREVTAGEEITIYYRNIGDYDFSQPPTTARSC